MKMIILIFFLLLANAMAYAQDQTSVPTAFTPEVGETPTPIPAKLGDQNPSQAVEEKAPSTSRPTAVPQFSLPDVVITGKNELTIGAKRLETLESDVSWGAESLGQVNRSTDDLPGLDKELTGLSTQETGASQDKALILHAGGGIPGTFGGWGLFGKDYTDMQYLLFGHYSTWGGQAVNGSTDGDQKYRFGGEFKFLPDKDSFLRLSLYSSQVQDTLPYQGAITEIHQGLETKADMGWKWGGAWRSSVDFVGNILTLNYWDQTALSNQGQEFQGSFHLTGEQIDPFWDSFELEGGDKQANSNFSVVPSAYNLAWARLGLGFIVVNGVKISGSLEGQSGDNVSLNSKLFPQAQLECRLSEPTLLIAYWKTSRYLDSFYDTFMDREHINPEAGLPSASEITGEWGGQLTHRVDENVVLALSASTAAIEDYHQWTDTDPSALTFIETYSSLPSVQLTKAKADLQWRLNDLWRTEWSYQFTTGKNNSGNGLNLTFLPQNQGVISVTRANEEWEATLSAVASSDFQALDSASLDLPGYVTLNLSATYHFDRDFSLWFQGDNLLGLNYVLQPGYLEPSVHLRGGLEIIL